MNSTNTKELDALLKEVRKLQADVSVLDTELNTQDLDWCASQVFFLLEELTADEAAAVEMLSNSSVALRRLAAFSLSRRSDFSFDSLECVEGIAMSESDTQVFELQIAVLGTSTRPQSRSLLAEIIHSPEYLAQTKVTAFNSLLGSISNGSVPLDRYVTAVEQID